MIAQVGTTSNEISVGLSNIVDTALSVNTGRITCRSYYISCQSLYLLYRPDLQLIVMYYNKLWKKNN